jgi:hypothetical protein
MMFDSLGRAAIRFGLAYIRHRYRREIRVGAAITAAAVGAAVYLAARNVREG